MGENKGKKSRFGVAEKGAVPKFPGQEKIPKMEQKLSSQNSPSRAAPAMAGGNQRKKIQIFLVFSGSFAGVSAGAEFQPYVNTPGFKSCFKPSSGPDSTAASLGFGISHSREFLEFWTPPLATL